MSIFGLEPGAQIIVLQGLSTYAALASAWYFARPVLRGQTVAASKSILSDVTSNQPGVNDLIRRATGVLNRRETANQPLAKRDNRLGVVFLAISLALFTGALVLQISTDASFHKAEPAKK